MISLFPAPSGFPEAPLAEARSFAIEALERFGRLLPVGFALGEDDRIEVFGGAPAPGGTDQDALNLVYAGVRAAAQEGRIIAATVLSEGEDGEGRDLIACFAESPQTGAHRAGAYFSFRSRPWLLAGIGLRRGSILLEPRPFAPIEKRVWTD